MKILTPARVTLLMLLVVGGLVGAYVAKSLLADDVTPVKVEERAVPMAVADLKPGTVITEAHMGLGLLPENEIREYHGALLDNRAIVGRVVKSPIQAGTPILSQQLYQPGEQPPLEVGDGMRAVSVSLGERVALVDGRIQPGQFVDVHMTANTDGQTDRRFRGGITLTLFKGVKLLAVNSASATGSTSRAGNSVTLELTPGQANIMILAANRGGITLSYNPEGRGDGGVGVTNENRATLEEILGLRPLPQPPKPFVTENFKGSSRSTTEFQSGRRVTPTPPRPGSTQPLIRSPGNNNLIRTRREKGTDRDAQGRGQLRFPSA